MPHNILIPFLLTLFAGLATGIGSLIALLAHRTNKRFLSFSLGLSAGVMIYVAFVEIFKDSQTVLAAELGTKFGLGISVVCFFAGMLLIGIIDKLVPSYENPHEIRSVESLNTPPPKSNLMRIGLMTALAIGIHNFPEGIATFTAALESSSLGIAIAVAVAIHNIPEGIAVSIPIFYATGSRKKAFRLSFLSGLAEPIGALLAYLVLMPFMSPTMMGCIFGIVSGIMIYISLDELLPAAREYGEHHLAIYGLVTGMAIMALSLILLA
ncbi:MAG: zinc transporter ZupT [Bacteroidales bacterium]